MYLVDTNVLSAGAPTHAVPVAEVVRWMERVSDLLFLSVITVAEVQDGIAKSERQGATRKAERLAAWLEALLHLYGPRILPLDVPTARALGILTDRARGAGESPGLADLSIAATALRRGYTVLTRNLRHFRAVDVPAHDPFDGLPPGLR